MKSIPRKSDALSKTRDNEEIKRENNYLTVIMSIAVVGGGVSGLSFALRASRLTSSKLTVYETRSKCGGWIEARVGKKLQFVNNYYNFTIRDCPLLAVNWVYFFDSLFFL